MSYETDRMCERHIGPQRISDAYWRNEVRAVPMVSFHISASQDCASTYLLAISRVAVNAHRKQ